MTTPNPLPCVEIRNYHAVVIAGRLVVTYEQRQPGAVAWQPVRIERVARPEDRPAPPERRAG
ncbi:MAG TPA: hypothetical protein VFK56_07255 [Mycobacterium sp.]|nr:hypothetical protein [Mycobacterium sp.]